MRSTTRSANRRGRFRVTAVVSGDGATDSVPDPTDAGPAAAAGGGGGVGAGVAVWELSSRSRSRSSNSRTKLPSPDGAPQNSQPGSALLPLTAWAAGDTVVKTCSPTRRAAVGKHERSLGQVLTKRVQPRVGFQQPSVDEVLDALLVCLPLRSLQDQLLVGGVRGCSACAQRGHDWLEVTLQDIAFGCGQTVVARTTSIHDLGSNRVVQHVVEPTFEPTNLGRIEVI